MLHCKKFRYLLASLQCYHFMLQVTKAADFVEQRFVSKLEASNIPHKVEITHFNTDKDSIGKLICFRAEESATPAVIMSKHNQGAIKEFFMGSVTKYCTQHCKQPVVILH